MNNTIPQDVPQKQCTACLRFLPATLEYFHKMKKGLRNHCKDCRSAFNKKDRQENHEKSLAYDREQREKRRETIRENNRRYEQRTKGKRNAYQREYKRAHPEYNRTYSRMYYHSHIEHNRAYSKHYRATHRDFMRSLNKAYYSTHQKEYRERQRLYRKQFPERHRASEAKRRALKLGNGGTYTGQDVQRQYARQKGKCYYCKKRLTKYHVDHIVPLSRGGSNDPSNLVIACPTCNCKKNNKLPHEWPEGGILI